MGEMQRDSRFDSGWPVALVFGLMAVFILGLTQTGQQLQAEMSSSLRSVLHGPVAPALPARPQVLVVTQNPDDEANIIMTVNPRGYQVVVAETTAIARAILRSNASRIGVVVIDTELAGAESVTTLAQSLLPGEKVIKLRRNHGPTDIAVLLLAAI